MEPNNPNTPDLKNSILARIEKDSLCPRSRWFYNSKECGVWTLWFLTVVFGALSVAVTLFVVVQRQFSFYEATHESFVAFAIEALPHIWILLFAGMVLFAVYNLRHTKNGYRYPLWLIFGSSLLLSLIGGAALHAVGVGFMLDRQMGTFSNLYQSQERFEQKMWQQPEHGRLVGQVRVPETGSPISPVQFEDAAGVLWSMQVTDLDEQENQLLQSGKKVRLLGEVVSSAPPQFYACAAFPWVHDNEYSMRELRTLKEEMRKRVSRHQKVAQMSQEEATSTLVATAPCGNLSVLRRLPPPLPI